MPDATPTIGEVLGLLQARGLIRSEAVDLARKALADEARAKKLPLFAEVMLAIGAWIASWCFVSFVSMLGGLIVRKEAGLCVLGAGWLTGALILHRFAGPVSIFFRQVALACSVAGHTMILIGAMAILRGSETVGGTVVSVLLTAVIYPPYGDPLYRFLSVGSLIGWLAGACAHAGWPAGWHALIFLSAAVAGLIFLHPLSRASLRPAGYACAAAVPVLVGAIVAFPREIATPAWPSAVSLGALLLALYAYLGGWLRARAWEGRIPPGRAKALALAVLATAGLAAMQLPGVMASAGLLVIGYAVSNRFLCAFGLVALPPFLIHFYYSVQMDLMDKSFLLMGSGAVCLLLRFLAKRVFAEPVKEGT